METVLASLSDYRAPGCLIRRWPVARRAGHGTVFGEVGIRLPDGSVT